MMTNITCFCNVITYSTVDEYWHFMKTCNAHCCLAARGIRFVYNIGHLIPYYTASCPRRQQSTVLCHCITVNMNLLSRFFLPLMNFHQIVSYCSCYHFCVSLHKVQKSYHTSCFVWLLYHKFHFNYQFVWFLMFCSIFMCTQYLFHLQYGYYCKSYL